VKKKKKKGKERMKGARLRASLSEALLLKVKRWCLASDFLTLLNKKERLFFARLGAARKMAAPPRPQNMPKTRNKRRRSHKRRIASFF
jgi:hypothetical protein